MKKYKIKIKRDFGRYGWYDSKTRTNRFDGFVVTDGFCNVMPGAVWFKTVACAMDAIAILEESIQTDTNFWTLYQAKTKT